MTNVEGGLGDPFTAQLDDIVDRSNRMSRLRLEAIFNSTDLKLLTLLGKIPSSNGMARVTDSAPAGRRMNETRLGILDLTTVKDYEGKFRQGFMELQQLGGKLQEQAASTGAFEHYSEMMWQKIDNLKEVTEVVAGRPVSGVRHAAFYYTGENGVPTQMKRNLFSNFPFRGVVHSVGAVKRPGDEVGGLEVCLVLEPYEASPLESVRSHYSEPGRQSRSRTVKAMTWVPIGGVDFGFDSVLQQNPAI